MSERNNLSFEFTGEEKEDSRGVTVKQIQAIRVSGNADVSGAGRVFGNARVSGNAQVVGDTVVLDYGFDTLS